jgi:hypothetical protein
VPELLFRASSDAAPASARRTTVFPNGHSAKIPIRNAAIPNGNVMMRMNMISAANA